MTTSNEIKALNLAITTETRQRLIRKYTKALEALL